MLLREGATFQFALIDGWHTFDQTLLDFYYLNRLLEEAGVILVDDLGLPAVNKAIRYVLNYPTYVVAGVTPAPSLRKSGAKHFIDCTLRTLARLLPGPYAARVFNDAWLWPGVFQPKREGDDRAPEDWTRQQELGLVRAVLGRMPPRDLSPGGVYCSAAGAFVALLVPWMANRFSDNLLEEMSQLRTAYSPTGSP